MTLAWMRLRNTMNASNGTMTMYRAVMKPERPAERQYSTPYCWVVLAVNSTRPQMMPITTGLPKQDGIAIALPSPSVIVGALPETRTREEPDAEC